MRMKKVLQGTALTALAAAACIGAGVADASAEVVKNPFPVDNVEFSLNGDVSMYVSVPKDTKEIMVGVASYNKSKGTVKIADTAWEVHDVKEENNYRYIDTIDLSKLSVTKDNYIAVKSDSTDPVYFRISPSIVKQKYEYNAGTNTITFKTFTAAENAKGLDANNTSLMYRTQFGRWSEVDCYTWTDDGTKKFNDKNVVFQEYQYQGATLYLRVAGYGNSFDSEDTEYMKALNLGNVKDAADNSIEYPLYNAGCMPSKEVKLNIAKQANGPSVKGDYVNGKVNIPANTQYRVIASGGVISGTTEKPYESTTAKATPTVSELLKLASATATSGTIEVRKAPVTTGKGKAASKWTRVAIEIPEPIDITGAKKGDKDFSLGENVEIEATGGAITLSNKIKIEVTTAASGSKKGQVNGVKVTVPSEIKYDVSVDVGAKKPTTVQSGKDKTIKVNAGTTIKIGKAGNKKSKDWASGTVTIGKTK